MDANKKFWERVAKLYTPMQEKTNSALYALVIDRCKKHIAPTARVLELACGTGQFTFPLCACAAHWEATDFSEKMIQEAQKRAASFPVSFAVKDASALTYPDASFDVVLIANALHIMPEAEKALAEIRRVLRPGGLLLAPTFVYEGSYNRLRIAVMELAGFKTFHHWTLDTYAEYLRQQGYRVIENTLVPGRPLPEALAVCTPD